MLAGIASRAEQTPGIDVLTHVAIRILHLRNVFYYFHITTAADTNIPSALRLVGDIDADIESLRDLIIDDYVQTLIHHEILSGEHLQDHELENVGPDHDVNSLGQEVEASRSRNEDHVHIHLEHYKLKNVGSDHDIKSPGQEVEDRKLQNENEEGVTVEPRAGYLPTPPSSSHTYAEDTYVHTPMDKTNEYDEDDDDDDTDEYDDDEYDEDEYDNDKPSCSICSEPYSGSHRAFRITVCGHIFGKECISKWVNSTACNANLCPECRTSLCKNTLFCIERVMQRSMLLDISPSNAHRHETPPPTCSRPDQRSRTAKHIGADVYTGPATQDKGTARATC